MTMLARTNPPASTVRLDEERALASVRSQAAFVRSLLDELDRVAPSGGVSAVNMQLVEELARLARRCTELAAALTPAEEDPSTAAAGRHISRCA